MFDLVAGYAGKGEYMPPYIQQIIVENQSVLETIGIVVGIIAGAMAIVGGIYAGYRWFKRNYERIK